MRFHGAAGKHTLSLTGQDESGRTAHADITVILDPVDPILTYAKPISTPSEIDRTLSLSASASVPSTLRVGTHAFPLSTERRTVEVPIAATCATQDLAWTLTAGDRSSSGTMSVDRVCGSNHSPLWWIVGFIVLAILIVASVFWYRRWRIAG